MPTLHDISPILRGQIANLFQAHNFTFATREPGRAPSLYFTMGGMNALQTGAPNGRLRIQHTAGPLIEMWTVRTAHWFFADHEDKWAAFDFLVAGSGAARFNALEAGMYDNAEDGDAHMEVQYNRQAGHLISMHPSGGTIDLTPVVHRTALITKVLEYMLRFNCDVDVDGATRYSANGPAMGVQAIPQTVPGLMRWANGL